MSIENLISYGITRRRFLKTGLVGLAGLIASSRWDSLLLAEDRQPRAKSCILLWMDGGPSQIDTFDPKPGKDTGGPFRAIKTTVPGIHISEHLPKISEQMKHLAIIRSMSTNEGSHWRATYQAQTGYRPTEHVTVQHPSLGSIIASEVGRNDFDLPHYVSIGGGFSLGAGFLGHKHNPFIIENPMNAYEALYLKGETDSKRFDRRLKLLEEVEKDFARSHSTSESKSHREIYKKASRMMKSPLARAFDLSKEKESVRESYGQKGHFGQGCLLARRLVEVGMPFVEVVFSGWDTHSNNFGRNRNLMSQLDPGFAALIKDLKERGLLDQTLVIWMGEFGRTPNINGQGGRDHYPKAWTIVVAGGGVQGGKVIGATDDRGIEIKERPLRIQDLFASVAYTFGIDYTKTYFPREGEPVRLVQEDAKVIKELFS